MLVAISDTHKKENQQSERDSDEQTFTSNYFVTNVNCSNFQY